jgi:hypothetical protein
VILSHLLALRDLIVALNARNRCQAPRISRVHNVNCVINNQDKQGASARLINTLIILERNTSEEVLFCLDCTLLNGHRNVRWEFGLHNNVVMETVLQILSAFVAAMTIKHPKNLDFRPVLDLRYF